MNTTEVKIPPYQIIDNFLIVVFNNKSHTVKITDTISNYIKNKQWDKVYLEIFPKNIVNDELKIVSKEFKTLSINEENGKVFVKYKNNLITGVLVDRLIALYKQGFPIEYYEKFVENVYASQNFVLVNELQLFFNKHKDFPLTEDGAFLAYRKVDENYMSYHANPDGTHNRNMIGDIVEQPRYEVDPDRNNTCAKGLHFCAKSYLPEYYGNQGRVMIVKIFPYDVVAIPSDYSNAKGRCCRYEVIAEADDETSKFAFSNGYVSEKTYATKPIEPESTDKIIKEDFGNSYVEENDKEPPTEKSGALYDLIESYIKNSKKSGFYIREMKKSKKFNGFTSEQILETLQDMMYGDTPVELTHNGPYVSNTYVAIN